MSKIEFYSSSKYFTAEKQTTTTDYLKPRYICILELYSDENINQFKQDTTFSNLGSDGYTIIYDYRPTPEVYAESFISADHALELAIKAKEAYLKIKAKEDYLESLLKH